MLCYVFIGPTLGSPNSEHTSTVITVTAGCTPFKQETSGDMSQPALGWMETTKLILLPSNHFH